MLRLFNATHNRAQHLCQLLRIRPRCQSRFLRAPQPRRSDKLHRAGNLLGVLHRADTAPKIEKCGHVSSSVPKPYLTTAATEVVNRSLKASTADLTSALIASSSAFLSAIAFKIEPWLVSTYCVNSFSKRRTSGTGMLSIAPLVAT